MKTMRFAAEDAGIIAQPGSMVMWTRPIVTCSNAGIFIVLFVSRLKASDNLSVERFPMTSIRQIASGWFPRNSIVQGLRLFEPEVVFLVPTTIYRN